jgi:hypothetical protein
MYWEEPTQMVVKKLAETLRYLRIRGGTVAVFGKSTWAATNAIDNTPIRVSSAMIRRSFH